MNLNGEWDFRFDSEDEGHAGRWFTGSSTFPLRITVPFSWGAPLSGVDDSAHIGWYARSISVPERWEGRRVFLVIGASDWRTTAWIDGNELGTHQGGYTPFEFELTEQLRPGTSQRLVLRVDDTPHDFKLEGKQGYGAARGIWQTPYLEVRGDAAIDVLHFTPNIGERSVAVDVQLLEPASRDLSLNLDIEGAGSHARTISRGEQSLRFSIPIDNARLWTLDDPHLYDVEAVLSGSGIDADTVRSYFGMREIGVVTLPGTDFTYVSLNGEPIYLETTLDQAYHPEGFYTFPSDDFMRDEILRSRQIGLNGMRVHVKVGIPRKLYWADRLGMLIMADVPNSWGEPTQEMRGEVEHALRQMIKRDYNHPAIFAWVPFNETWGLYTEIGGKDIYTKDAQEWVVDVYNLAKSLDASRLVEDNSVCCGRGHTQTDINSWHVYTTGYDMAAHLDEVTEGTRPGSTWNFEAGYRQAAQPLFNSEFGNVWGYEGSTGDVDWSWDYHIFINEFRRHPRVSGWLYTEHHDVINEWNGYWRYDRSEKFTGMDDLVPGMTLRDMHSPFYVAVGEPSSMSREAAAGATVEVPLWASFMTGTDAHGNELTLTYRIRAWDRLGRESELPAHTRSIAYNPWRSEALDPLSVKMPDEPGVAVLALELSDAGGVVLHRNFTTFVVQGESPSEVRLEGGKRARLARVAASDFSDASWSMKQWDVLDGLKVNGAGHGFFEYRIPWPAGVRVEDVETGAFLVEASAKQLYGKDRENAGEMDDDYMRGRGTHDPSLNPNAYPMTDEETFPGAVTVRFGDVVGGTYELPDDPADHRGILSWHSQLRDRRLREAGSYGWLIEAAIPRRALERAADNGELVVRLEVDESLPRGLAIYGERFGRYPVDPTLKLTLK
ncbi:MAG: sugar-binding domain-containing protein [Rhodothermales bacterium]